MTEDSSARAIHSPCVPGPPTRGRLYLARHGRTGLNAAGVLRGRLDPPLDPVGRQEAENLASILGIGRLGGVVSSPLRRALETAEAIAARAGLNIEVDARLIDRDYGEWAGQPRQMAETAYGSLDNAPGVEPLDQVQSRVLEALGDLADRTGAGPIVAVSHDAVIRLLLSAADPNLGQADQITQRTGCYNTLDYRSGAWIVDAINQSPWESGDGAAGAQGWQGPRASDDQRG